MRDGCLEGAAIRSRFPLRFRRRGSLLGHPIPAGGLGLPRGRLTGHARRRVPDLDGVTAFRTHELRPGWVPSIPRGRRCSSRLRDVLSRRLPLCCGQSLAPAPASPRQGSASRGINEGSRDSPVRSSLACGRPGGTGRPWASPRASHPAVTGDARRGWDRPSSTDLELHAQIRLILQSGSSLIACDLASHRPRQASAGVAHSLPLSRPIRASRG
jgi:hypothetical protein